MCNYWLAAVAFQADTVELFETFNDSKLLISKFYLIIDLNGMVKHFFDFALGLLAAQHIQLLPLIGT